MIAVTGGAGFIGSAVVHGLNQLGEDNIIIVDNLGTSDKWKNLVDLKFKDYFNKNEFITMLENGKFGMCDDSLKSIFHFGACSTTTKTDNEYLIENNYKYTIRLSKALPYRYSKNCRFIYASSAATYGNGEHSYDDDESTLHKLKPLNMYAYSKHLYDLYALREKWLNKSVGLKFFNVFGANEYHKDSMRSLICKQFDDIKKYHQIKLFKAYKEGYDHGDQERDFVYIKDVVKVILFIHQHPEINGIFNVGTGVPRSWNDLAKAAFKSLKTDKYFKQSEILYEDMPDMMKNKYQYYTCANINKLRSVGYKERFMTLEESINDYIQNYLLTNSYLGNYK